MSVDSRVVLSVEARTHGRVLVRERPSGVRTIVGFHGYGQTAESMLDELEELPGADRSRLASVQALHRFYTRGDRDVVASWMTRQDRESAIADNVAYVDRALDDVMAPVGGSGRIVLVGFSQGVAMAYRAARFGRHPVSALIALAGDMPPDVKERDGAPWPPVLVGAGERDPLFPPARLEADALVLASRGVTCDVCAFPGGHEWTAEFRAAAGAWIAAHA